MTECFSRRAAVAAFGAAATNFLAGVAMLVWLRPGLPVPGSALADRMAYVAAHPGVWKGGWLLWNLAAISLIVFFVSLAGLWQHRAPILCPSALLFAAGGLAADLSAEAIYMLVAPGLDPVGFAAAEATAGVFTGFLGNGLYTVAGILLTRAGAPDLPRALLALAILVWTLGAALSIASVAGSAAGQLWSTACLMPLFIVWAVLVGRWLRRRES